MHQGASVLSNQNDDNLSLNDKLSCFVSLSLLLEHTNQELAQQYWIGAYEEDPIQATILHFFLTDTPNKELLYSLFQNELITVATKYNVLDELHSVQEYLLKILISMN